MKTIAVLGANGQLGKTLQSLAKSKQFSFCFYTKEDLDITDKQRLEIVFNSSKFHYCINCSAYTNVDGAEDNIEEAFAINAEGVKNIAEVCAMTNTKLIHISTDYVFDGEKTTPYKSDEKPNPINQYGKSKLRGEIYIQEILEAYYIIRTSWLYSAFGKNFLKTILDKIENNQNLKITTEQRGTPTSCIDLSEFIFHIIEVDSIAFGIYNFSAQGDTTWYGFSKEIAKHIKPESLKNVSPSSGFKTTAKRPKYSILDLSKTERIYRKLNKWQYSVEKIVRQLSR